MTVWFEAVALAEFADETFVGTTNHHPCGVWRAGLISVEFVTDNMMAFPWPIW